MRGGGTLARRDKEDCQVLINGMINGIIAEVDFGARKVTGYSGNWASLFATVVSVGDDVYAATISREGFVGDVWILHRNRL